MNSNSNGKFLWRASFEHIGYCLSECLGVRAICIQIGGLLIAGIIHTIFSTISSKIPAIQLFIRMAGYFIASLPVIFAMTASTALITDKERNGEKHSVKSVLEFTQHRIYNIAISLFQIFAAVISLTIFLLISDLLVKIPYIGELLWPLVYLINLIMAAITVAGGIAILLLIHLLPSSLVMFTDNKDILNKNLRLLKNTFPDWIYLFSISTVMVTIMFSVYFIITTLSMRFSQVLLHEKFYSLISAIPMYPGYLLGFIIKRFLPFDFVYHSKFTVSIGAFIWSLLLYAILCVITAICLNIFNFVGATFLKANKSSFSSE